MVSVAGGAPGNKRGARKEQGFRRPLTASSSCCSCPRCLPRSLRSITSNTRSSRKASSRASTCSVRASLGGWVQICVFADPAQQTISVSSLEKCSRRTFWCSWISQRTSRATTARYVTFFAVLHPLSSLPVCCELATVACRRLASSTITRSIDAPSFTCSTSPKPQPGSMPRPLACLRLRPPVRVHPLRLLRAVQRYRPPHQHPHARHHYQACPPACPSRPARLFSCLTHLTGLFALPLSRSLHSPSHTGR